MNFSPIMKRHKKMMMTMDNNLFGKEKTTTTISDLPEEVLTEVLVRLSVKGILACVRVRKSWHSLIKTPMFSTLYSTYNQKITNPIKYLLFWNISTEAYEIRVDDIQCELYLTLKNPPEYSGSFDFQLVSNGLICLFDYTSTTIHLWNPVIQKCKTLPDSPHYHYSESWTQWQAIAFGFVPEMNDYVVVYMIKYGLSDEPFTQYPIITCVYSLNTNCWKKITHDSIPFVGISQHDGVFVNGVAIWAGGNARGDKVLLCFDTKTEMLREILLPEWVDQRYYHVPVIHAFDQSIVYFVEDDYSISSKLGVWVLKGNSMNEFLWEKKMMVELQREVEVNVMGVRNNGEPILVKLDDLISYNLDTHKSYDFGKSRDSWIPFIWNHEWEEDDDLIPIVIKPFAESLGLLDIDCTKY